MARGSRADVCLIIEGAYPYVVGGVASWLQDLIQSLPDFEFSIVAIKADDNPLPWKVEPPANVTSVQEISLVPELLRPRRYPSETIDRVGYLLLRFLTTGDQATMIELIGLLSSMNPAPKPGDILSNPQMFEYFRAHYSDYCPAASFHHYFWAMRILLGGLLSMLLAPLPPAKCYHSISTGFAGLLATRATYETRRPAFVTEHGIYLIERQIEVMMADWIGDQIDTGLTMDRSARDLRDLWTTAFESYTRACYEGCNPIIALYKANNNVQKRMGASPDRVRVIANGIEPGRFANVHAERTDSRLTVGLIGRVVPIKDVKTFIRAAGLVLKEMPDARFVLLGPEDEDIPYAADCRELVAELGIGGSFSFEGRVNVGDWLPQLDILCLTSLSEAQPLVILEAGSVGIPAVAPDVGSCREMIEGRKPAVDKPGGIVTALVNPEETARALLALLKDPDLRKEMGNAMRERVQNEYNKSAIIAQYRELYRSLADSPPVQMGGIGANLAGTSLAGQ